MMQENSVIYKSMLDRLEALYKAKLEVYVRFASKYIVRTISTDKRIVSAEDIVQEAFICVHEFILRGKVKYEDKLNSLLIMVIKNICLNIFRAKNNIRNRKPLFKEQLVQPNLSDLKDENIDIDVLEVLKEFVTNDITRELIIAQYVHVDNYKDLAIEFRINESYARQLVSRARRKIKKRIKII